MRPKSKNKIGFLNYLVQCSENAELFLLSFQTNAKKLSTITLDWINAIEVFLPYAVCTCAQHV
jgi:hypothetical protein